MKILANLRILNNFCKKKKKKNTKIRKNHYWTILYCVCEEKLFIKELHIKRKLRNFALVNK